MAALSPAALAPSEQRQRSPISAIEALPGRLSAFTADRGARPPGPPVAVGTEDGTAAALAAGTAGGAAAALVVGTAVAAGTKLGWVGAALAAAMATGAECPT